MATVQAQITTQTINSTNITNKAIEIDVYWNTAFPDKNYVAVTSSSCSRDGSPLLDTFQEAGFRDIEGAGIAVVLNLLSGAEAGDVMTVYAVGYEA
jgi:hypothetical protein